MNTHNTRRFHTYGLVLATIVLGCGVLSVWLAGSGERAEIPAEQPALALSWRSGHAQRYQVSLDSQVRLTVPGSNSAEPLRQQLDGEVDFRTLEVATDHVTVGFHLSPVEYRVAGASLADIDENLAQPFRVVFDPSGLPTAFEFPEHVDLQSRALLEELVRTFQVCVREGSEWETEEIHATGTYAAHYRRTDPVGPQNGPENELEKTKRRYVANSRAGLFAGETRVLASSASIRIDPEVDWLETMTVDERLATKQDSGVAVDVTTHAQLRALPAATQSMEDPSKLWAFTTSTGTAIGALSAEKQASRSSVTTERERADLRERMLKRLEALDQAKSGRALLVHELRDLLLADEELANTLLAEMAARPFEDRTRADLFLVFELAGTPTAQAALTRVASEPSWARKDALRALVALGGVANPTEDSLRALWSVTQERAPASRELASTAALALGAIGGRMREHDGERYAALSSELERVAWQAGNDSERAVALMALGNTGDQALATEVAMFFDDSSPKVRKAAAHALRRLGTDSVREELLRRLPAEPSSSVRSSMAAALDSWESPTAEAMETIRSLLPGEVDETARLSLVKVLGRQSERFPENTRALEAWLEREDSTTVRKGIATVLAEARRRAGERSNG